MIDISHRWYHEDYWDPDYDQYLQKLADENPFPAYSEEYDRRPVPDERVGGFVHTAPHHPDCIGRYQEDFENCNCKALFELDYQIRKDEEIEAEHQEWWQ